MLTSVESFYSKSEILLVINENSLEIYVYSCLERAILIKISADLQTRLGLAEDSRTTDCGCKLAWSGRV